MAVRSFSTTGIVLKRHNIGETDRVVTMLTQDQGKITCIAKGVRTLQSSKRAYLEPGNYIKAFCIFTHGMPILTQASLISDTGVMRESLKNVRKLHQFLEIIDRLFVEEELELDFFNEILTLRELILSEDATISKIRRGFDQILNRLGYSDNVPSITMSILEQVATVTERPIRSYEYLVVKPEEAW